MKSGLIVLLSVVAVGLFADHNALADDLSEPTEPAAHAAEPAEAVPATKAAFREQGRFGVIGALTNDGFQSGVARIGEHYEAAVTVDASFERIGSAAGRHASGDMGVTLRGGARVGLGAFNYLTLGGQGHVICFGKDEGVSTWGSISIGPYVGVQRHFAGTPLVIGLWVLPYQFDRAVGNDGEGKRVVATTHQFFQAGGFGLTYLL